MIAAAGNRPCPEMGSRCAHERAAVLRDPRAAVIAGFAGTSNLEAGRSYGLYTIGTSAHASHPAAYDNEREASRRIAFPRRPQRPFCWSTPTTWTTPCALGVELAGRGASAAAFAWTRVTWSPPPPMRELLDSLGNTNTKITVTRRPGRNTPSPSLAAAPVDLYGVGTRLVTGSGAPTSSMVYKVVARENRGRDAPGREGLGR